MLRNEPEVIEKKLRLAAKQKRLDTPARSQASSVRSNSIDSVERM